MGQEHDDGDKPEKRGHRVTLPGFVREDDIGLGDLVTRATRAVGVAPCGGCARRAERLNRWVGFGRRRR
ncbi:hypothetical protein ACIRQY_22585 [Streptomyces sp. NPDC101490]|uniref:hypothetical protein n=1 Tax=unclassified Streptomyces TaxID=2593676 RepID=UPI00332A3AAD